ncbi:hypothetical protein [Paenibacillus silviterrae]|nr:hypothetical protein [Paenibacillus chinjuensis]
MSRARRESASPELAPAGFRPEAAVSFYTHVIPPTAFLRLIPLQ